jgi:hypothetical protein
MIYCYYQQQSLLKKITFEDLINNIAFEEYISSQPSQHLLKKQIIVKKFMLYSPEQQKKRTRDFKDLFEKVTINHLHTLKEEDRRTILELILEQENASEDLRSQCQKALNDNTQKIVLTDEQIKSLNLDAHPSILQIQGKISHESVLNKKKLHLFIGVFYHQEVLDTHAWQSLLSFSLEHQDMASMEKCLIKIASHQNIDEALAIFKKEIIERNTHTRPDSRAIGSKALIVARPLNYIDGRIGSQS